MPNRSGKFYRKNEAEVMESLGLKPTKNSGSGWVEKSDGQSDRIICELKSTDAQSYRLKLEDLHKLEYNANVAHKLPVFAVQFLAGNEVFLLVKPELLRDVAEFLETGECSHKNTSVELVGHEECAPCANRVIKSSSDARERFKIDKENMYKKDKSAI